MAQARKNAYYSRNNDYNSTSTAYDFKPEEKVRRRIKKKKKQGPKYVHAENLGSSVGLTAYLIMGVIFACAFICVLAISNTNRQKIENNKLLSLLKEEQSNTANLTVEVSETMDLDKIEEIARTKLKMSEPQAHQIRYINIPKQSYTIHYDTEPAGPKEETKLASTGFLGIFR